MQLALNQQGSRSLTAEDGGLDRASLDHLYVEPDWQQVAHVECAHDRVAGDQVFVVLDLDAGIALLPLLALLEQGIDLLARLVERRGEPGSSAAAYGSTARGRTNDGRNLGTRAQ